MLPSGLKSRISKARNKMKKKSRSRSTAKWPVKIARHL